MNDETVLTGSDADRRRFIRNLAGGTAALSLGGAARLAIAKSADPIKIGCLNVFTKAYAGYGEATLNGLNLYFEQAGWKSAGRKVVILKEDDEMTSQTGLEKARKLVERERVHVIAGPLASNVAMAMVDYMKRAQCFWLVTGAGATELTWNRMPYMFRTTLSNWQVANPMGTWVYDNIAKEIVLTGSDFVSGHDSVEAFKQSFTARGGKIIKEFYPPLGTTDFSAYLTEIGSLKPPATYSFYGGTDSVRFVKQYAQYGLKDKSQLIGFSSLLDNDTLPGQGATALGGLSSSIYCDALDNAENREFVAAYRKRLQRLSERLRGIRLHHRAHHRRSGQGGRRQRRRQGGVRRGHRDDQDQRAARPHALRSGHPSSDPERLRAQGGRDRRAARQPGHRHHSRRRRYPA